jgi:hypothetical protein
MKGQLQEAVAEANRYSSESLTDIARSYNVSHTTIGRLTMAAPDR